MGSKYFFFLFITWPCQVAAIKQLTCLWRFIIHIRCKQMKDGWYVPLAFHLCKRSLKPALTHGESIITILLSRLQAIQPSRELFLPFTGIESWICHIHTNVFLMITIPYAWKKYRAFQIKGITTFIQKVFYEYSNIPYNEICLVWFVSLDTQTKCMARSSYGVLLKLFGGKYPCYNVSALNVYQLLYTT